MGPFQARLTALSRTNATYVLFVDADDLLNNPNIIQLSVFQAEKYKADCVQFSELVSNLEWTKPYNWGNPPAFGPQKRHFMLQKWAELGVGTALHGKLMKTSVLKEAIQFLSEKVNGVEEKKIYYAEDLLIMIAFHFVSDVYVGIKDVGYLYFDRVESSTEKSLKMYQGALKRAEDTAYVVKQLMNLGLKQYNKQFKEQIYRIFLNAIKKIDIKLLISQKTTICSTYLDTMIIGNKLSQSIIEDCCSCVKKKYTGVFDKQEAEFDRTFGCGNEFQQSQCYICYIRRFLTHFQTTIVYYYTKFIEFIVIKTNILKLLQKIK
ncbi:Nucleotide-diphospho-sugar_transferases [Hexamita inflata]|uniref:Nucleotide-diphospho-sugar transferases n=1 Tax=Hexamita inflata TaxID=28002 RepID=A0AA86UIY6_9EUKA|nr:Nucleotide-diphospho-sugar transferases [Hexamita inflata]